jgi:hypothetical protein
MQSKRDQLMVKLLFLGALRRGELFGLRWHDYDGETIYVQRQITGLGDITSPKTRAKGIAKVAIPTELQSDLNEWKKWCPDPSPDAWMFPSRANTPLNAKNWYDRVLVPSGRAIGLSALSYHWFRRGHATEAHQLGTVDKNIQAQMRHGSPNVTRQIYMQNVAEGQKRAVNALEQLGQKNTEPQNAPEGAPIPVSGAVSVQNAPAPSDLARSNTPKPTVLIPLGPVVSTLPSKQGVAGSSPAGPTSVSDQMQEGPPRRMALGQPVCEEGVPGSDQARP